MMHRPPFKVPSSRFDPWILAFMHMVIAIGAMATGMTMKSRELGGRWSDLWQAIPQADLHWMNFWHLHAQPPGFSLWGWFWIALAPNYYQEAIQIAYIGLAMLTIAMIYSLATSLTRSRTAALAAGLLVALNPALFYFEAYLLYEILVVTLVTASAWFLERAIRLDKTRWLVGFVVVLNLLVLTRSLYHLVFLFTALAFAWPAWRRLGAVRALALFLAAITLPVAWNTKNYFQYGFFGSSSWFGMGLVRCVVKGYTSFDLVKLANAGEISQVTAQRWPYDHKPSDYTKFGFTRTSTVPFLSCDDFHNINIPAISRQYQEDSKKLIRVHTARYLKGVHTAYKEMSTPVSRFRHLQIHQIGHIPWEFIYSQLLYGQMITEAFVTFYGEAWQVGSMFYYCFPLLILCAGAWAIFRWRKNRRRMQAGEQPDGAEIAMPWVMAYMIMISTYVILVGILFEYGENERFRFGIEQLNFLMVIILIRAAGGFRSSSARSPRADQASGRISPAQ